MKLTTLIIDDEKYARENLQSELEAFSEVIHLVGEANNVKTAIEKINQLRPQLVFLDINLGDGLGFDVLEKVSFKGFKTVFITAYDQYAIRSFRVSAIDYLLKPLNREELKACIEKLDENNNNPIDYIDQLLQNMQESKPKKISIPSQDGFSLYEISSIIRCQSDGNYTVIYFADGKQLISSKHSNILMMLWLESGLNACANSHLVNLDHIRKYINLEGGMLKMSDGSEVPISQRRKSYVISVLENL